MRFRAKSAIIYENDGYKNIEWQCQSTTYPNLQHTKRKKPVHITRPTTLSDF